MAALDREAGEVAIKILYFGPSLGGKTQSILFLHSGAPAATRTALRLIATETEHIIYFGARAEPERELHGYPARLYPYGFPGQFLPPSHVAALARGLDGLVFVADSHPDRLEANVGYLRKIDEALVELGLELSAIPRVLQYNKRDLPDAAPLDVLEAALNPGGAPSFATMATSGVGVREAFDAIASAAIERVREAGAAALTPMTSAFMSMALC